MDIIRKIIHVDMDAFFTSVEQRDNPLLRGKPVAVGGSRERGVVAAASYEARKYGVFSAMSSKIAIQKCPQLIFVKARFDAYKEVSRQIRDIFNEYTDLVEPLSLDEAYLDVTENKKNMLSATYIAKEIKDKIKEQTQLTASAGVSYNKFLAKVASDFQKPDGLTVITPEQANDFIEKLPIHKFYGIGKVTTKKMLKLRIKNGADLKNWEKKDLNCHFGKAGTFYYHISRGIDLRTVNPIRIRKSFGSENTFEKDLEDFEMIRQELEKIGSSLFKNLEKHDFFGRTLTLKVKYHDFQSITRSKTLPYSIEQYDVFQKLSEELLEKIKINFRPIRLLGLAISNLDDNQTQHAGTQLAFDF